MQSMFEVYFWGKGSYRTYWYAFFVAFPFTWRNVIIPNITGGLFNEYLDVTFYMADALLLMCIISILKHEKIIKSIKDIKKMFHVEHSVLIFLLVYTLINFSIAPSKTLWIDAFLSILRVGLVAFITYYYFIVDKSCSTWNKTRIFIVILFVVTSLQLSIALAQYMSDSSVGIYYLGEQILSTEISGVAEIDSDSGKQLRSYGTFLHPNIFGGYVVILFVIYYSVLRLPVFHVEQKWNIFKKFHVEQIFFIAFALICLYSIYISQSKSAILAFCLSFMFILFHVEQKWNIFKKFHVEQILLLIAVLLLIVVFTNNGWQKSFSERGDIFANYHDYELNLLGHGLGNDVYLLQLKNHIFWQWQPIHNIFYKIVFEYGYLGSIVLSIFLLYSFFKYIVPRGTIYLLPLLPLVIIGNVDHYLVDIYVGNVLLGLSIGLILILSSLTYILP